MNKIYHKPQIILVLGMHRSGTSLIAQLISKWGAYMGDDLLQANEFNPGGYWEYRPLVDLHEKILKESESSWYAPVNIPPTEKLLKRYGAAARSMVEQMDQNGNVWCWKDPRMPLFLSFWQKILTDRKIVYVVVYRHPYSIATSLHKRDHFPVYILSSLWELTSLHIFESLQNSTYYVVDYDETIFNPEKACKQLFRFLDQAAERNEKTEVMPEALQAVKPSLNHERTGIQFNISEFQQRIIDGYLSGTFDQLAGISASHMEKLRHILHLFTKQKTGEHLAQLFYEDDSGRFSENKSIIRKIETNETKIKFVLSRPIETRRLRFDPLNDYALVRINALSFYLKGTAANIKFDMSSNAVAVENGEYLFSTGDPQMLIQIEKPENQQVDEIIFELEYLRTGKQVLPLLMKLKEKEIEDHSNLHTAEIKKLKINFRQKIDHQAALLEQLRKQQKSEQDQLTELRKHLDQLGTELAMIHSSRTFRYRRYLMLLLKPSGWKEVIAKYSSRSAHAREIRLIKSSGFFDEAYYLKNNPDVKNHRISPAKHYLMFGEFENRDPSAAFNNAFYFEQNPDVLASRINPLIHFLKHGKNEGRLPLPPQAGTTATSDTANAKINIAANSENAGKIPHFNPPANDYSLMVPFNCQLKEYRPAPQIAVICHLFYVDLLEEIKHYLEHILFPFRLFITTDTEQKQDRIKQFFTGWRDTNAIVKVVPNRGRDIAPKLLAWPEVYREYEFFLHIHSKKTVQEKVLSGWREYLYETLLGSEEVIKSIFEAFSCDQDLGIIAPQHFQNIRHAIGWGYNYDEAEKFAGKLGISISKDGPVDFPSGSMFWGRSAALKPILDSGLTFSDFPEESGQIDNTLSHVIERLFFFACEKAGFDWIKINSRFNKTEDERTLAVENLEHLRELIPDIKGSLLNRGTENVPQERGAKAEIPAPAPLHERMRYTKIHARSPYAHLPLDQFLSQLKLHISGEPSMIDFDEEFYLQANPDVERLVSIGLFDCGFTHYCLNGKYENRLWSNSLISKNFNLKAHYPDGMVKPVNIRPKFRYDPIDKPLKKSTKPYLLILFGHLQRSLFYAGYRAFFRDFDAVFPMFEKIVLSVEFDPIETELATQYCNRIEVIGQKDLYDTEIMPDLIICFSNHLFAKALKLFNRPKRMIYYCQEYEAGFFPYGMEYIEAEKAVAYSQNLIISTVILRDFLANKGLLNAARIFVSSPEIETFDVKPGRSRKLFFYFRPEYFHTRNLPEIIWEAVREFCNKNHDYDLYLVGTIDTSFSFHRNGNRIYVLSKLPNEAYIELISSCDAVVSMIYSAHPGVVAYQAAASGIPTVTNVFENRNAAYLRQMSENIVPYDPVTDSLSEKVEEAMLLPKGRKSFRNELYAGNDQASLTGFIFEILNQSESYETV